MNVVQYEIRKKGLCKTLVGTTIELASPFKKEDPGVVDKSSCSKYWDSNDEGP